jgi:hypothetical protein
MKKVSTAAGKATKNFRTNPNLSALTGVSFTDNLPSGLSVAVSPSLSNTCGGSVSGATGGSGSFSL